MKGYSQEIKGEMGTIIKSSTGKKYKLETRDNGGWVVQVNGASHTTRTHARGKFCAISLQKQAIFGDM